MQLTAERYDWKEDPGFAVYSPPLAVLPKDSTEFTAPSIKMEEMTPYQSALPPHPWIKIAGHIGTCAVHLGLVFALTVGWVQPEIPGVELAIVPVEVFQEAAPPEQLKQEVVAEATPDQLEPEPEMLPQDEPVAEPIVTEKSLDPIPKPIAESVLEKGRFNLPLSYQRSKSQNYKSRRLCHDSRWPADPLRRRG